MRVSDPERCLIPASLIRNMNAQNLADGLQNQYQPLRLALHKGDCVQATKYQACSIPTRSASSSESQKLISTVICTDCQAKGASNCVGSRNTIHVHNMKVHAFHFIQDAACIMMVKDLFILYTLPFCRCCTHRGMSGRHIGCCHSGSPLQNRHSSCSSSLTGYGRST